MSLIWGQHEISGTLRARLGPEAAARGRFEGACLGLSLLEWGTVGITVLLWWVFLALIIKVVRL